MASFLSALAVLPVAAEDQDKVPEVRDIMRKLHKGAENLKDHVGKALKAESPNWEEVQRDTKVYATLAEALGKNEPPKGDASSWKKLTGDYTTQAKALDDAAKKMDRAAASAVYKKLASPATCKGCHSAHKG